MTAGLDDIVNRAHSRPQQSQVLRSEDSLGAVTGSDTMVTSMAAIVYYRIRRRDVSFMN